MRNTPNHCAADRNALGRHRKWHASDGSMVDSGESTYFFALLVFGVGGVHL